MIQPQRFDFQTIESHFSLGQNTINFMVYTEMARRSLAAKDNPTLETLRLYYNALTELSQQFDFLMIESVLDDFEKNSRGFMDLYIAVWDRRAPCSQRTIFRMLTILKNMRFILNSYLQKNFKYFYRMSDRQPKGLKNLDHLIKENVFI